MTAFVVRIKRTQEPLGFFEADNPTQLARIVEDFAYPLDCEFAIVPKKVAWATFCETHMWRAENENMSSGDGAKRQEHS